MKALKAVALALTLGILSASTFAQAAEPQAKNISVLFKKNTSSATYKNTITGATYHQYNFRASGGQALTVKLQSSNGAADAVLFSNNLPDSVTLKSGEAFTLPATGDYQIRVLQPRAFANKGKKFNYTMTIAIQ